MITCAKKTITYIFCYYICTFYKVEFKLIISMQKYLTLEMYNYKITPMQPIIVKVGIPIAYAEKFWNKFTLLQVTYWFFND